MESKSPLTLPNLALVETILQKIQHETNTIASENAEAEWKRCCLKVLCYGTDYHVPTLRPSTNVKDDVDSNFRRANTTPVLKLKIRSCKALSFLLELMAKFDAAAGCQRSKICEELAEETDACIALEKIDKVRLILADSLWVVGQCLSPPDLNHSKHQDEIIQLTEAEEELREESLTAYLYIVQGLSGMKVDPPPTALHRNTSSTLPTPLLQMLLDSYTLDRSGTAPSYENFTRRYVKFQTNVLYRQKRFNLLAEESEGWAKVITLLCSFPQKPPHSNTSINSSSSVDCDTTLQELRAYIGTFDLDPNRVLAVILDVLEVELEWTITEFSSPQSTLSDGNWTLDLLLQLLSQFKVSALPHLLGFLLENHIKASTLCREQETHDLSNFIVPRSFFNLVAFLLIHKLVDSSAIFPYFSRTHQNANNFYSTDVEGPEKPTKVAELLPQLLEKWTKIRQKEISEEINNWGVVRLNAAASEIGPASTEDQFLITPKNEDIVEDKCAKCPLLHLMEAVLFFGAWNTFMDLFTFCRLPPKFENFDSISNGESGTCKLRPFEIDFILLFPAIGRAVCDLLHHVIDAHYDKGASHNSALVRGNISSLVPKSACLAVPTSVTPSKKYSLLLDSIFDPIMMLATSHKAINDVSLCCKVCGLIDSSIKQDYHVDKKLQAPRLSSVGKMVFKWYLLPSLSLYSFDSPLCQLLWQTLKCLPYADRYELYDAWAFGPQIMQAKTVVLNRGSPVLERGAISRSAMKGSGCSNSDKRLWSVMTEVVSGKETRAILKRLSKETIQEQGERFARVSSTSPIVAYSILIQQMQAYDNMIELMVDSFRQCTDLSRDVLVWCIIRNLDDSSISEPTASSQIASAMETFVGELIKVFPHLEIGSILDLILARLLDHKSSVPVTISGLGIIRSLLSITGGLEAIGGESGSISKQQLEGRAGSLLLRRETVSFGVFDKVSSSASTTLRACLLSIGEEPRQHRNAGLALLLRLCQLRMQVLFDQNTTFKDVAKVSKVLDTIQSTIILLLDFLSCPRDWDDKEGCTLVVQTYVSSLPSFSVLVDTYQGFGINKSLAWLLCRPCIRAAMIAEEEELEKLELQEAEQIYDGIEHESQVSEIKNCKEIKIPVVLRQWLPNDDGKSGFFIPDDMIPLSIAKPLFTTFWSLDLYDIFVPKSRYAIEINRLAKEEERLFTLKSRKVAPSEHHPFDSKAESELRRVTASIRRLKSDQTKQAEHFKYVKNKMFESLMKEFFPGTDSDASSSIRMKEFYTSCILPRCVFSPDDALFCAKFLLRLHSLNCPNFHTLALFELIFSSIGGTLMAMTEEEAQNLAILVDEIWSVVVEWRFSGDFEKEIQPKLGGLPHDPSRAINFEDFKELYTSWQKAMAHGLIGCLHAKAKNSRDSAAALRQRSAFIILNRLVRSFPTSPDIGDQIFKELKPFQDEDQRLDIKPIVNAYYAQLTKAVNEGCWKEQTATQRREREQEEKARVNERKRRAEQIQVEMDKEISQADMELGIGNRGRTGDRRENRLGRSGGNPEPRRVEVGSGGGRGADREYGDRDSRNRMRDALEFDRHRPRLEERSVLPPYDTPHGKPASSWLAPTQANSADRDRNNARTTGNDIGANLSGRWQVSQDRAYLVKAPVLSDERESKRARSVSAERSETKKAKPDERRSDTRGHFAENRRSGDRDRSSRGRRNR